MEREIDKKNLVLKEDESIGTVQIADDVVAMIASLATTEVDGVSAMAGNITNELMSKVGKEWDKSPSEEFAPYQISTDNKTFFSLRAGLQFNYMLSNALDINLCLLYTSGDIVGRSGCFKFKLSANSVMRGRVNAIRTFKGLVADLRVKNYGNCKSKITSVNCSR